MGLPNRLTIWPGSVHTCEVPPRKLELRFWRTGLFGIVCNTRVDGYLPPVYQGVFESLWCFLQHNKPDERLLPWIWQNALICLKLQYHGDMHAGSSVTGTFLNRNYPEHIKLDTIAIHIWLFSDCGNHDILIIWQHTICKDTRYTWTCAYFCTSIKSTIDRLIGNNATKLWQAKTNLCISARRLILVRQLNISHHNCTLEEYVPRNFAQMKTSVVEWSPDK